MNSMYFVYTKHLHVPFCSEPADRQTHTHHTHMTRTSMNLWHRNFYRVSTTILHKISKKMQMQKACTLNVVLPRICTYVMFCVLHFVSTYLDCVCRQSAYEKYIPWNPFFFFLYMHATVLLAKVEKRSRYIGNAYF